MRAALQNRTLGRILATSGSSNLADGMVLLALPLVAAQAGASPFWIGVLSAAQTVWWLLSVPLSTLVDRIGVGPLLRFTRSLRLLVALAMAVVVAVPSPYQLLLLIVLASAWGFLEVLADSAVTNLPALLLPEDSYDESYGLLSAVQRAANLVLGPALAGFLFSFNSWGAFAVAAAFLALSFLMQRPLLRRAEVQPIARPEGEAHPHVLADVVSGWRHIVGDRFLRAVMITLAGIVVAEEVVATVVVPYARDGGLVNNWESMLGYLRSLAGLVSIGATLIAATLAFYLGRLRVMALAVVGGVAAPLLLALEPSVSYIFAALLISAVAEALWVPLVQSEVARRTPRELMARTRATLMFITWGTMPLTSLLGGGVATWLGVPAALLIAAAIACGAALLGVWPLAMQPKVGSVKRET
jgi:MFS family permease